jgi:hypothetical protein
MQKIFSKWLSGLFTVGWIAILWAASFVAIGLIGFLLALYYKVGEYGWKLALQVWNE